MNAPLRIALVIGVASGRLAVAAQSSDALTRLDRMTAALERYYDRAIRIVSKEEVSLQPLDAGPQPPVRSRSLLYERRTERAAKTDDSPFPDVRVIRKLLQENGRAPRPNREPVCYDLLPEDDDPLIMFLDPHRRDYVFKPAGEDDVERRDAVRFDFESIRRGPVQTAVKGDCMNVTFEAGTSGRVWVDKETDAILRLDTRLTHRVDFRTPGEWAWKGGPSWMSLDRWDTSVRFRPIAFTGPDETLILPVSIEAVWTFSGAGRSTMRSVQRFTDYHRFVTSSRMIDEPR